MAETSLWGEEECTGMPETSLWGEGECTGMPETSLWGGAEGDNGMGPEKVAVSTISSQSGKESYLSRAN